MAVRCAPDCLILATPVTRQGTLWGSADPNYYGQGVASVMHSIYYGCSTDEPFPTGGDIWNGTLIADGNVPEN